MQILTLTLVLINLIFTIFLFFYFRDFVISYKFRHFLKNELENICNQVILNNKLLISPIVRSILIESRDLTKKFAEFIFFTKLNLNEDILLSEAKPIIEPIKTMIDKYFTEKRIMQDYLPGIQNEVSFLEYLKYKSGLKIFLYNFISQAIECKNGKYNGKSKEKFVEAACFFMKNCMEDFIKLRHDFGELKIAIPKDA